MVIKILLVTIVMILMFSNLQEDYNDTNQID